MSRNRDHSAASPEVELLEQVDEWADGVLPPSSVAVLSRAVAADPGLAREREALERLGRLLRADLVTVGPEFADTVMARLRPRRSPALAWVAALAAVIFLAVLAGVVLAPAASLVSGPLATLADFFASAAVAGSGLLAVSWRGLGDLVAGWLGSSAPNWILGSTLVIGLNGLLLVLLRRRRAAAAERTSDRRPNRRNE